MAVARVSSARADLDWLLGALFAPEALEHVALGADGPTAGAGRSFEWVAEPARGALRLLVPVDPAAAAVVARRSSDGTSVRDRARGWVAEGAFRAGAVQRLPGRRLALSVATEADRAGTFVVRRAEEAVGRAAHSLAITLGPRRYNRKPVVMLFDERSRPFAVLKVGVDRVTDDLVGNEGEWLDRAAGAAGLVVPTVLHRDEWRGHPFVVMGPITTPRLPGRLRVGPPSHSLVEAVAALTGTALVPAEASPVLADARRAAEPGDRLAAAAGALATRFASVPVRHGSWHGDLTPWNVATTRRGMIVWDWELAADGRPVGSDRAHSRVLTALELEGRTAAAACAAASPDDHAPFQPDRPAAEAAWALHLLDVARREAVAAAAGATHLPGLAEPALDLVAA